MCKITEQEKIRRLTQYYKDDGLVIVGLNHYQGVNAQELLFKKGVLEYLTEMLTTAELEPTTINVFSQTINTTGDIDYFLKNNISVEEIKLSQIYSAVSEFEKTITNIGLPRILSKMSNIYTTAYTFTDNDKNVNISTLLHKAMEPILIYSSGVNDLMRELGIESLNIKKEYKRINMEYILDRIQDPNLLKKVINSIESNYTNILGINPNTDIYTLGTYIPKFLEKEKMKIFRDLLTSYNKELSNLCEQYNITFINMEEINKKYTFGFRHNTLANYILNSIYHNKFETDEFLKMELNNKIEISDKGAVGIIELLTNDYNNSKYKASILDGYSKQIELEKANGYKREIEIFKKILVKKSGIQ